MEAGDGMGVSGRRRKMVRENGKADYAPYSRTELQAIGALMHDGPDSVETDPLLRILPVSPWRIHAHWSVPDATWHAARTQLPAGRETVPVLRFFDFTPLSAAAPRPHPPFDVAVDGTAGRWYVDVWKDGKTYVAELGLRSGDHFVGLARSSSIDLPVAGPSSETTADWRPVRRPQPENPSATPGIGHETVIDRPLSEPFRPLMPRRMRIPPDPVPSPRAGGASTAAPPPDIIAAPPPPFPHIQPEDSVSVAAGRAEAEAVAYAADLGADELRSDMDAPISDGGASLSHESPSVLDGGAPFVHESAADDAGIWSDGGALPPESVVNFSSFSLGEAADIDIRADLVIYGRARPGAMLSLFGRPVAVAADGTFSVRRPLPQGALVLPLTLGPGDGGEDR